jgi:excisionase family DNA binding protein
MHRSIEPKWITVKQAAVHAAVSQPTLRREVKAGRLTAYRVGGRRALRFTVADIDLWYEATNADRTPQAVGAITRQVLR